MRWRRVADAALCIKRQTPERKEPLPLAFERKDGTMAQRRRKGMILMEDRGAIVQKNSIRFKKVGAAMYHSHHDLIRFWERAVRRAGLPVRMTQGFNPRPRMVFLHALGVGVASLHEEVELEFYRRIAENDVLEQIRSACGGVLEIDGIETLPPMKKGRAAKEFRYEISGWPAGSVDALPGVIESILAEEALPMRRGPPGGEKVVDVRPYLLELGLSEGGATARVANTLAGTARPDEIALVFSEKLGIDAFGLMLLKTEMVLV